MPETIANKLKLILTDIIKIYQSAFVRGRLIRKNAIIAFNPFTIIIQVQTNPKYLKCNLREG